MTAVTVLMPVHNGERFVGEAIESTLRQSFADFEFLVVDDGSTDGTARAIASIRDPRIRVLTNATCIGLAKSLNRGLASATAPLIARQDADDRSHPDRLAAQIAFLRANPGAALVGAQVRLLDERGRVLRARGWRRPSSEAAIRFQLLFDSPFIHSSVVFRREVVWDELGGYDEKLLSAEDFELWSRLRSGIACAIFRGRSSISASTAARSRRSSPASTSLRYPARVAGSQMTSFGATPTASRCDSGSEAIHAAR